MINLFTVHGTFAQDENRSNIGDKWWQYGSEFLTKLQVLIDEPLQITPIHWSGENSEVDRRKTGEEIATTLSSIENRSLVIAHSHGGSAAIHALTQSKVSKDKDSGFPRHGLVTIGMPFIQFRRSWNPIARLNLMGQLVLIIAALFVAQAFRRGFFEGGSTDGGILAKLQHFWRYEAFTGEFAISVLALLLLFAFSIPSWKRARSLKRNSIKKDFGDKISSLAHTQDEAIGALTEGTNVRPSLITAKLIGISAFSAISLAFLAIEFGAAAFPRELTEFSYSDGFEDEFGRPTGFVLGAGGYSPIRFENDRNPKTIRDRLLARSYHTTRTLVPVYSDELWRNKTIVSALSELPDREREDLESAIPDLSSTYFFVPEGTEERFVSSFASAVAGYRYGEAHNGSKNRLDGSEGDFGFYGFLIPYDYDEIGGPAPERSQFNFPTTLVISHQEDSEPPTDQYRELPKGTRLFGSEQFDRAFGLCAQAISTGQLRCNPSREILSGGEKRIAEWILRDFRRWRSDFVHSIPVLGWGGHYYSDNFQSANDPPEFNSAWTNVYAAIVFAIMISCVFAILLKPVLSNVLSGTLKNSAYGNDGNGEQVTRTVPPNHFCSEFTSELPESVEREMVEKSTHDIAKAVERIRSLFFVRKTSEPQGALPISEALQLKNSELIHNAYFHSDSFVKYLAAVLSVRHEIPLSSTAKSDVQIQEFVRGLTIEKKVEPEPRAV